MRKKIYFIVIFILLLIGGTYAYFNFTFIGDDSYELVNNIYITFQNGSSINISNGFPESDESARNHETESVTLNSKNIDVADNEMVFYISGNNEDSNSKINISFMLNDGSPISSKVRLKSKYLKFDLIEFNDLNEIYLVEGLSFPLFNDTVIYNNELDTSSTHYYKLRMWIDENMVISDTDPNADYGAYSSTTKTLFKNTYASVKLTCIGELSDK